MKMRPAVIILLLALLGGVTATPKQDAAEPQERAGHKIRAAVMPLLEQMSR